MIAHMGWIGLGQNFRKKYGLDWIGSEIDWIGLGLIKKIGPMSNSGITSYVFQSTITTCTLTGLAI